MALELLISQLDWILLSLPSAVDLSGGALPTAEAVVETAVSAFRRMCTLKTRTTCWICLSRFPTSAARVSNVLTWCSFLVIYVKAPS